VFYTRYVQRDYKEANWDDAVSWELSSAKEAQKIWRYGSVGSSVVGYSPDSNDVSIEAEKSPLLRAVTKQRVVKALQAEDDLACSDL
jgi:hypothetical protein